MPPKSERRLRRQASGLPCTSFRLHHRHHLRRHRLLLRRTSHRHLRCDHGLRLRKVRSSRPRPHSRRLRRHDASQRRCLLSRSPRLPPRLQGTLSPERSLHRFPHIQAPVYLRAHGSYNSQVVSCLGGFETVYRSTDARTCRSYTLGDTQRDYLQRCDEWTLRRSL